MASRVPAANETAEPDESASLAWTRRFVFLERETWSTWSRSPLLSRPRFDPIPLKLRQCLDGV